LRVHLGSGKKKLYMIEHVEKREKNWKEKPRRSPHLRRINFLFDRGGLNRSYWRTGPRGKKKNSNVSDISRSESEGRREFDCGRPQEDQTVGYNVGRKVLPASGGVFYRRTYEGATTARSRETGVPKRGLPGRKPDSKGPKSYKGPFAWKSRNQAAERGANGWEPPTPREKKPL